DRIRYLIILFNKPIISIIIKVTKKRDLTSNRITDSIFYIIKVKNKRPSYYLFSLFITNGDKDLNPKNTSIIFKKVKI
ncbi:hypothetical protein CSPX01_03181, partial [Colletotrichum filicis]